MSLHCVEEQNFHDQQLQIRRFDFESVKDVWHKSFGLAIYKNQGGTTHPAEEEKKIFFSSDLKASILHPPSYLLTFLTTSAKRRNSEVVVAYSYIIVRCVTKLFLCNKCQISHWFQSEFVNSGIILFSIMKIGHEH